MTKSTLAEIDRLEGIAQAYRRGRPIVPMRGVIEDCNLARVLVAQGGDIDTEIAAWQTALAEARGDVIAAQAGLDGAIDKHTVHRADLDELMASLSARLER